MISIYSIEEVSRSTEVLHPKAKHVFTYKVNINVNDTKHVLYGVVYDRPHTGTDKYGLIKIDVQDVPIGNIQNVNTFKDLTSSNTYNLVVNEVMSALYDNSTKSFPIAIKESS